MRMVVAGLTGLAAGRLAARIADRHASPNQAVPRGRERPRLRGWPGCAQACDPEGGSRRSRRRIRARRERVPFTEFTTAMAFAAVTARFGFTLEAIPALVAATALITLSAVDLRSYRLPDAIVFPSCVVSAAVITAVSLVTGRPEALAVALAAAAGYGTLMWAVHEANPRSLGFGDVKLSPLLGMNLGWTAAAFHDGWTAVFALTAQALLLSSMAGLALGLAVAGLRRAGHDVLPDPDLDPAVKPAAPHPSLMATAFPFGPALAVGTMAVMLFPETLLR